MALAPPTEALKRMIRERVRRVAHGVNTGMMLWYQIAVAWPDAQLLTRLVTGFTVTGRIELCPLFHSRLEKPVGECSMPDFMVEPEKFVNELKAGPSSDPDMDKAAEKATSRGIKNGDVQSATKTPPPPVLVLTLYFGARPSEQKHAT